jgi:hypothetical protein
MKKLISLSIILILFISLWSASVLLLIRKPSEKHTGFIFVKPYGKPVIGETYTFSGKKYVFKKGTVIIAPTQWGNFLILKH